MSRDIISNNLLNSGDNNNKNSNNNNNRATNSPLLSSSSYQNTNSQYLSVPNNANINLSPTMMKLNPSFSLSNNSLQPQQSNRISDLLTSHLSSMDDLVSETGLDDNKLNSKLKLKYYNKALISYLSQQGLNINPLKLNARHLKEKLNFDINNYNNNNNKPINSSLSNNSTIETFITGNGQILFLPFNPQKKKRSRNNNIRDEYDDEDDDHDNHHDDIDNDNENIDNENENENINNDNDDNILDVEADEPYEPSDLQFSPRSQNSILNNSNKKNTTTTITNNNNNNTSNNNQDQIHNITNHTFSVIVKLNKKCNLNKIVKVNYHTHMSTKLIPPEYSKREPIDERFRTSEMIDWDLDLLNPDCYIPFREISTSKQNNNDSFDLSNMDNNTLNYSLESDSVSIDSTNNDNSKQNADVKYSIGPTQEIKTFKCLNPKAYVDESNLLRNESLIESNLFKKKGNNCSNQSTNNSFLPGYYIFLLPVVYPLNTPESIQVPHAYLEHQFSIQIQKATVILPTLQAPQTAFLSTSPSHHYKYDEQNFDYNSNSHVSPSIKPIVSPSSSTKSSFFKKIGIHKSLSTNQKIETSSSPKKISTSPLNSNNFALNPISSNSRVRSNSNTNHSLINDSHFHSNNNNNNNNNTLNPSSNTNNNPIVYNYNYKLPAIRLPPSDATSTLNKSIYVNKVWNKALNYELLLPKKFTQLSPPNYLSVSSNDKFLRGNTFLLQMKLVPLVKNLQLKRIKINIVEKITYTPKYNSNRTKKLKSRSIDRVVTMLEIKTKDKPNPNLNVNKASTPLKTQVIKGCLNDNLLTFCYNNEKSSCFKETSSHSTHSSNNHRRSSSSGGSNGVINNNSFKSPTSFLHGPKKMSRFLDNPLSHNSNSHSHFYNSNNNNNNQIPDDVIITNPVKLQCPLNFIANDDSKFISTVYENLCTGTSDLTGLHDGSDIFDKGNDTMSIFSVGSNGNDRSDIFLDDDVGMSLSPVRRQRNLSISNSTYTNNSHNKTNNIHEDHSLINSHTFLPDVSSSNLKVRHRLQISFRISRPDPKIKNSDGEPKLHHYEVIVDTPIVFISPFCVTEALDLPSYEDAVRIGMFEVVKNSSKFAISQLNSNEYDSNYYADSSSDENAIFMPCSPLMSDTTPYSINNNLSNINTSAQFTNILASSPSSTMSSLPAYDNNDSSFNRKRSNSGYLSLLGTTPINATSLLSAAFSRSKEASSSLNSVLANDFSNLSLNKASGINNTIDGIIHNEDPPPEYTEIGFIHPNIKIEATDSEISTPSILTSRDNSDVNEYNENANNEKNHKIEMGKSIETKSNLPLNNIIKETDKPKKLTRERSYSSDLAGSRTSLKSEKMALLHNYDKENVRNSTVESLISNENISLDLGDRNDVDSIINMNMGNIPTLNLTPTQNGI